MTLRQGLLIKVAIIAGALLLALLAEGCSTAPAPSTSSQAGADSSKPYGSLTVAGYFGPGMPDPQLGADAGHYGINATLYDSLVELSLEGQPRPGIAERWEIAPDGMTHTFYLRKGVKFHNGDELTAADSKFSLERMLAPEDTYFGAGLRGWIASVEAKDDYTVVLRLKKPSFDLLDTFANMGGVAAVLPKKYIEEKGIDYFRKNPVGSGPWKFVSFEPGNKLVLEANEEHWRAVPKFKTLTSLNVPDEATRSAMLKTGELDMAEVAGDSAPGLKSAGIRLVNHQGGGRAMAYLFWDLDNPGKWALGDVKVRKALSLGIDRKELADKLYGGYATPRIMEAVSPGAFFFDANVLKPDPYDPEGAKKLIAEAGYSGGFDLKIWDRTDLDWSNYNQALAGYWRKVGVKVNLERIDFTSRLRPMLMAKPKAEEVYNSVFGVGSGGLSAMQFERMAITYHSKQAVFSNIRNPQLDELLDKVPTVRDPAEKKRLALEAAVLAKNEYAHLGVLNVASIVALGSKIGDFTPIAQIPYFGVSYATLTHPK
ncbi:MAG: ABC transporter substrate-binding protein [Chloroflexi bacterium]|nr:ABC transporter substrate-binding protein [Chloroflexota bacterium]